MCELMHCWQKTDCVKPAHKQHQATNNNYSSYCIHHYFYKSKTTNTPTWSCSEWSAPDCNSTRTTSSWPFCAAAYSADTPDWHSQTKESDKANEVIIFIHPCAELMHCWQKTGCVKPAHKQHQATTNNYSSYCIHHYFYKSKTTNTPTWSCSEWSAPDCNSTRTTSSWPFLCSRIQRRYTRLAFTNKRKWQGKWGYNIHSSMCELMHCWQKTDCVKPAHKQHQATNNNYSSYCIHHYFYKSKTTNTPTWSCSEWSAPDCNSTRTTSSWPFCAAAYSADTPDWHSQTKESDKATKVIIFIHPCAS